MVLFVALPERACLRSSVAAVKVNSRGKQVRDEGVRVELYDQVEGGGDAMNAVYDGVIFKAISKTKQNTPRAPQSTSATAFVGARVEVSVGDGVGP
ncbi:unnamed protein product [Peronospora belbahrii]|uniref:Uncharacterized protein n=1 Tax=Peronospora belbahrii TaxID=622444 RepID=A0ABN8CXB1_9STRA|nr:unnamed protein product [Peronospora belbahrii]